ncbi:EF-hand domain-containing protein 1-like [Brachionichthys hirsutus]|uniref:EF-hand domain-containing protein 1-like n=1 Tax=Brachionichthys hirsutus TaxID=412623 RepID=UPI0036050131
MSWNWNSHKLPFLPGCTFRDVTKSSFHRPQTLGYRNGYAMPRRPAGGVGRDPLLPEQPTQQEINELRVEVPDIRYDVYERGPAEGFVPAHVALDKKVLRFYAYFEESVLYSPEEDRRVRPVVVFYYLEDDSMALVEPPVENSGMAQGKRIKRQRLPKNARGDHYRWKDLNLAQDLQVYGVTYRVTHCDAFTQEFMESQGIVLNDPEAARPDPYSQRRRAPQPSHTTPSDFDRTRQFLTMDRKVLRFFALWDDADSLSTETRPVTIQYFLVDDTVEVREVHEPNSGRDPAPVLMRRQKLHKKVKPESEDFPRCVLEMSPAEVDEYYSPRDFPLGQPVTLLGRVFRLHDCDAFTREYYRKHHPDLETSPLDVPRKTGGPRDRKQASPPPWNGFGSLEDSLQNCLSLIPGPPKKNVLKMLENSHRVLRYSARLDSQNPDDEGRRFVLSYFLSTDMISISEKPTRNSGIIGGQFLEKTRVPKPGSTVQNPEFYSPADFAIGSTVEVFGHRFVLTDADRYVMTYLQSVAGQVPGPTLESLQHKLGVLTTDDLPGDRGETNRGETNRGETNRNRDETNRDESNRNRDESNQAESNQIGRLE